MSIKSQLSSSQSSVSHLLAALQKMKIKCQAVRNLPWFAHLNAFFHLPNPRIFTLFLISTSATFFFGVAMIVDWSAYGHRHQGYGWVAYYAPMIIALPLIAWAICLVFAVVFFKNRIISLSSSPLGKTKPTLASPPRSLQPEKIEIEEEPPQLVQEQVQPTDHNETTSSIEIKQDSSVLRTPPAVSADGQKAVALADYEEITAESSECMTKKTYEELGLMGAHENNHHEKVKNEETQSNKSSTEMGLVIQQEGNSMVSHQSRGKSQDDSICNLAFTLPLCYTPSLRLKRNLSF